MEVKYDKEQMYYNIKLWYQQGLWTAEMVQEAVTHGVLTQEQCDEILASKPNP